MKFKFNLKLLLYTLFLLIFPAMTIELYSGSTPPINYFTPLTIFFFIITYGLPFVLIRELKIRWKLTWQYIFLFPIMGIFIEGIFMQSFFNTAHEDLGILSDFGVLYNVQWPWSIYLIIMHGIFSVTYPLYIVDILFPKYRNKALLKPLTALISGLLILLLTLVQFMNITIGDNPMYAKYDIHIIGTLICVGIIGLLILIAFLTRNIKLKRDLFHNRKRDHAYSFLYLISLLLTTYFFAEIHLIFVLIGQCILTVILIFFSFKYIYTSRRTKEDLLPIYNGTTLYFSLLAIMQENGWITNPDPVKGMGIVGISFLILMVVMNILVFLRKKKQKKERP